MNNLVVKIYVNTDSRKELEYLIEKMNFENKNSIEIDVVKNSNFNKSKAKEFPDGFLYFPLLIEYYSNEIKMSDINNTKIILNELWKNSIPAVASCSYEDELPEKGGYKSKNVVWI